LISNGFRAVFDELVPACERSIGHSVTAQSGTSTSLIEKVNAGEAIRRRDHDRRKRWRAWRRAARSGRARRSADPASGIGSRAGARKPDIGNAEALKKTFLAAKSITYAGDGASRPHIDRMMVTLGIADVMTKKTLLEQGLGPSRRQSRQR
jgi:molybdate transport system substrate-binding protein